MAGQKQQTKELFKVDYLFLGLGAANSLILIQLDKADLLKGKVVAVVDDNCKSLNEKTFCFWAEPAEVQKLGLEAFICNSWQNIKTGNISLESLNPGNYYHIEGRALYLFTQDLLIKNDIRLISEKYTNNEESEIENKALQLENITIQYGTLFDSRPPKFKKPNPNESHLLQSFIGWKITNLSCELDATTAVLMDFNIPQNNSCQFIYLLPFDKNSALVEVTRFGKEPIVQHEAELILTSYLQSKNLDYEISEYEYGCIPMSSVKQKVEKKCSNRIKTGTNAGMLKPSSGYAFKAMATDAIAIKDSIKNNTPLVREKQKGRFKFYDRLLLKILEKSPNQGKPIFEALFKGVKTKKVLQFLDEKSTLGEEIHLFSKLPLIIFLKTAFQDLFYKVYPALFALIFTITSIILTMFNQQNIVWFMLGAVFLTYGLAHGALDHLIGNNIKTTPELIKFISNYIVKGLLLGLLWWVLPDVALVCFILFSAWHFGQADFIEWKIKSKYHFFLWGLSVFMLILMFHWSETLSILNQLPGLTLVSYLEHAQDSHLQFIRIGSIFVPLILSIFHNSLRMMITLIYLLLCTQLPLLLTFGIYFTLQHSFHGWLHLKSGLNINSNQMLKKALPYSGAAIIFFLIYTLWFGYYDIGFFFILLSCISMPHVFTMHGFYKRHEA